MTERTSTISPVAALKALGRVKKFEASDEDFTTLAQFVAEAAVKNAPSSWTGLPCECCGQPQEQINIERVAVDSERVRVRIASELDKKGIAGLRRILNDFTKGI